MDKRCLGERRPGALALRRVLRLLTRMDVAAILILVVLLLAILGSCFPQRPSWVSAEDPDRLTRWQRSVQERYGGLTRLLRGAGAFQWFDSPLLWLAKGLLMLADLVCTVKRWRGLWRRARRRPVSCPDAAFDSAIHAAELPAASAEGLTRVIHRSLEQRGFSVRFEAEGAFIHVRGDRNRLAPLATLITHLAVLVLVVGVALSVLSGWREELTLRPGESVEVKAETGWWGRRASELDGGSGLQVRNEGLRILRHMDGSVAGYGADLVLSEARSDVMRGEVRLNQPLTYRGIAFTLQGYAVDGESHSVTLRAVRDPGYHLVVTAGLLMLVGLTVSFNFPHCCIHVRIEPGGIVRLAGRADRRAWGFGRQFATLVREIGGWNR